MDPVEPSLQINLNDLVDTRSLNEIFKNFYTMFKIPMRLFDLQENLILEINEMNPVCSLLNSYPKTANACMVIRKKVKLHSFSSSSEKFNVLPCFCGLEYVAAPIIFQSEHLGKLVVGPFLTAPMEDIPEKVFTIEPKADSVPLKAAYIQVPRLSHKKIQRFSRTVISTLDCLFFSAHKANITSQMHLATVRESYRELTEKNRRLEEMVEERKEFDRRKSNFLAMVSHELRTPLTSIIGYSDMLAEGIAGELAEEQKQFVGTIKSKGDELLKLISSILDFSQVDSGRLSVQAVPTDVPELMKMAIANNQETADRRGLNLSMEAAPGIPTVQLDAEKITTALSHLVDNAIKFSAPGGVVKVSARIVDSNEQDISEDGFGFVLMAAPDMLEIVVQDFGVGIADHEQTNIFAPFTQMDESSTREHGGAGLGLAIVQQYVEGHGGRVHVSSRVDEGSVFSIRIPIANNPL